jgi:hypothetical protein
LILGFVRTRSPADHFAPAERGSIVSVWFVYRSDGPPSGPFPTEAVAEAILSDTFPFDGLVKAPSTLRWIAACEVPVIARLVDSRRSSGVVSVVPRSEPATIRELDALEPPTIRSTDPRGPDRFPIGCTSLVPASGVQPTAVLAPMTVEQDENAFWRGVRRA